MLAENQSKATKLWEEFKKSVTEKGFLKTVTGSDSGKEWAGLQKRVNVLPEDYQEVWLRVSAQYWGKGVGGVFDTSKDVEFFDGILTMLEDGAQDGLGASEVIGEDAEDFAEEVVGTLGGQDYRDKWRKQLNDSVMKKLGRK